MFHNILPIPKFYSKKYNEICLRQILDTMKFWLKSKFNLVQGIIAFGQYDSIWDSFYCTFNIILKVTNISNFITSTIYLQY